MPGENVAATPPCTATPSKRQLEVRHPLRAEKECAAGPVSGCSAILLCRHWGRVGEGLGKGWGGGWGGLGEGLGRAWGRVGKGRKQLVSGESL